MRRLRLARAAVLLAMLVFAVIWVVRLVSVVQDPPSSDYVGDSLVIQALLFEGTGLGLFAAITLRLDTLEKRAQAAARMRRLSTITAVAPTSSQES